MTAESLDPRRESLVAALYGELSAEEERALRALLAEDAELRAEWEALSESRAFLVRAAAEEQAPAFVFLDPEPLSRHSLPSSPVARAAGGLLAALRAPAFGFGLAAAALFVLMIAGLRVDRQPGGLIVHFGDLRTTAEPGVPASVVDGQSGQGGFALAVGESLPGEGIPIESAPNGNGTEMHYLADGAAGGESGPGEKNAAGWVSEVRGGNEGSGAPGTSNEGPGAAVVSEDIYLTRAEFAAYSNRLIELMAAGFESYERRRQDELHFLLTGIYEDLETRQERSWDAMNEQFAEAWIRLAAANEPGGSRLEAPIRRQGLPPADPGR